MMFTRRAICTYSGASMVLVLTGCGRAAKPTPINIAINADAGINPGATGDPSPVVVRVYELKGIKAFNNASYFDFDKEAETLGADLIGSREYELIPGTQKEYKAEISSEAAYIGVVASFRNIKSADWRDSVELKKGKKNRFVIYVTGLAVRIQLLRGFLGR